MGIEALECPACGAPLPATYGGVRVTCAYCGRGLSGVDDASWDGAAEAALDDEADRVDPTRRCAFGARTYAIAGRLARGESSDVFLADRATRFHERVVVKLLRAPEDADLLAREWRAVHALHASEAQGAPFFRSLLPQPVRRGEARCPDGVARPGVVYRWRSGFQHTLDDVARAQPSGAVDARTAVWIWRRLLESLGFVHASGWAHGAVLPRHVMIHPRDHGAVLAGWSGAARLGEPIVAVVAGDASLYPRELRASPALDVAMSARCIGRALGEAPLPSPLADLLATASRGAWTEGAWTLKDAIGAAAQRAFGAPTYHPLAMPGWS